MIKNISFAIGAALLSLSMSACQFIGAGDVDLILYNGEIHTMDDSRSVVSAVAISGNRIIQIGSDEEVKQLKDENTRLIDLQQRMVLPGFFDTHTHMGLAADYSDACPLHSATKKEDLITLMKACEKNHKGSGWLWGFGFNPQELKSIVLSAEGQGDAGFSLQELDQLFPNTPIAMVAIQHDFALINSAGIAQMGYGQQEDDLTRKDFVRDENGQPTSIVLGDTGVLRLGLFDKTNDLQALKGELNKFNSLGYTSFFDAGIFVDNYKERLRQFKELDDQGELSIRANLSVVLGINGGEPSEKVFLDYWLLRQELDSDRVKLQTIKVFGDLEPHMVDPYEKPIGDLHNGEMVVPPELLSLAVEGANSAGFSIYMHVMGDGSVHEALNIFEQHKGEYEEGMPRHTLSHLTFVHPDDLARFKALDIVANISPVWAYPNSESYMTGSQLIPRRVGEDRTKRIMAFKDLHDQGAILTSSSDYPYSSVNPFEGIEVGITRKHPKHESAVFGPEQRLSLDTMIESYTRNAAYEFGQENQIGSLDVGKLADLIVLDQNLYQIEPEDIGDTQVVMTLVDGEIVFQSERDSAVTQND